MKRKCNISIIITFAFCCFIYAMPFTLWAETFTYEYDAVGNMVLKDGNDDAACVLDVKFEKTTLSAGMEYYTDRAYTFTNVPAQYIGLDMIKTPNDDRNLTAASDYLTFELQSNATLYVAYDQRATGLPDWISGFTDTGDTINTSLSSQQYLKVYSKSFLSGNCVNLGANKASGFSGGTVSNYVVFYGADAAAELTVSITAAEMSELGGSTTATVMRNSETSGSLLVNLSSNDESEATVPATVTIAAGQTTSPSFTVTAVDDALVDGTQTVTVRAIAVGHADGTDTIDVTDNETSTCVLDVKFEETTLSAGMEYYTDRAYTFTNVPAQYIGMDMIKTPNDDRNLTAASDYLTFELQSNATLYVAYDQRATGLPDWMSGFTDTGDTINTSLSSQQYLKIYSKSFLSGDCVNLGANKASGFSGGTMSNYVVFY